MYEDNINYSQYQAEAAWIDYLNSERLRNMAKQLTEQKISLKSALKELWLLRNFLDNPEHILGSSKTKHGEIAENLQVRIANAKRIIEGLEPLHSFDGVPRTAPVDYTRDGASVQQKFYNTPKNTFDAIKQHLEKYPSFIKNGGSYDIPKDQHQYITELLKKPYQELNHTEKNLVDAIHEWEKKKGISFSDKVKPSDLNYKDVQSQNIDKTVSDAEKDVKKHHKEKNKEIHKNSKANFAEGVKVTAVSSAIEGGLQCIFAIYDKLKSGKKFSDFTEDDWKDIGFSTVKGAGTGAVRGSSIYLLSNTLFKNIGHNSAAVASGYVSAVIGVINQTNQYRKGELSQEDYIINSQVICFESAVSVIGAAIGNAAIPVVGAVVGAVVSNFLCGLGKEYLSRKEQELINQHQQAMKELVQKLDLEHQKLINKLEKEFEKFSTLADMAFDLDINRAFAGSVKLAKHIGVSEDKILKTKSDIDIYFLS